MSAKSLFNPTLHCIGSEIAGFVWGGGAFRRHLDASRGIIGGEIHYRGSQKNLSIASINLVSFV